MSDSRMMQAASGVAGWRYPAAGDAAPPRGVKVLLLTRGCVAVTGDWSDYGGYIAWSPLPTRDKDKEARVAARKD